MAFVTIAARVVQQRAEGCQRRIVKKSACRPIHASVTIDRACPLVDAPPNFANAVAEVTAEERSESDAFGVSHLGCDFFDALIARLQEVYGAFHSQVLEIAQRGFAHDRFHSASQGSFACTRGFCRFIQRKSFSEATSRPAFELLNHRVGMREMVVENIGGLRGSPVHDQILSRQCRELGALLTDERKSQVHMTQRCARSYKSSGFNDHSRFVETNPRIALPK